MIYESATVLLKDSSRVDRLLSLVSGVEFYLLCRFSTLRFMVFEAHLFIIIISKWSANFNVYFISYIFKQFDIFLSLILFYIWAFADSSYSLASAIAKLGIVRDVYDNLQLGLRVERNKQHTRIVTIIPKLIRKLDRII